MYWNLEGFAFIWFTSNQLNIHNTGYTFKFLFYIIHCITNTPDCIVIRIIEYITQVNYKIEEIIGMDVVCHWSHQRPLRRTFRYFHPVTSNISAAFRFVGKHAVFIDILTRYCTLEHKYFAPILIIFGGIRSCPVAFLLFISVYLCCQVNLIQTNMACVQCSWWWIINTLHDMYLPDKCLHVNIYLLIHTFHYVHGVWDCINRERAFGCITKQQEYVSWHW